jgi:hypothetical protein
MTLTGVLKPINSSLPEGIWRLLGQVVFWELIEAALLTAGASVED